MSYSINKLAKVAGVSVRALHYYDEVGLLSPKRDSKNSYRVYSEADLLILQQILFYKELDFPLDEIKKILNDKNFDVLSSLKNHKKMILARKKRIDELVKTIDKTILKLTKNKHMNDDELYDGFSKEELAEWNKEAKERWGNTEQYKQSVGKYESLTREQKLEMKKAGDELMKEIVANMDKDPGSPEVQALVQRHYDGLKFFYEPNLELYKGLADIYAGYSGDERFRAYFEKYDKNLPEFMRTAMHIYCDRGGENK
jgi:DNA-binding transcriptional MerR regulator